MKKTFAEIGEMLAKRESKYSEKLSKANTTASRNSAKLMLKAIAEKKQMLMDENEAVAEPAMSKFEEGGPLPKYKEFSKKYGSIGVDEVDMKYQELVDRAETYLQELYPGKKVSIQTSSSLRGLDRQKAAKASGASTTSVSLHQFGGARDFNIYVDGKKKINKDFDLYEKTLWRAAEDLGMHHLDKDGFGAVDPYHIGLVKEGEDDTWENFFKENPSLLEMDSSQQVIDTLNQLRDKDPKYAKVADLAKQVIEEGSTPEMFPLGKLGLNRFKELAVEKPEAQEAIPDYKPVQLPEPNFEPTRPPGFEDAKPAQMPDRDFGTPPPPGFENVKPAQLPEPDFSSRQSGPDNLFIEEMAKRQQAKNNPVQARRDRKGIDVFKEENPKTVQMLKDIWNAPLNMARTMRDAPAELIKDLQDPETWYKLKYADEWESAMAFDKSLEGLSDEEIAAKRREKRDAKTKSIGKGFQTGARNNFGLYPTPSGEEAELRPERANMQPMDRTKISPSFTEEQDNARKNSPKFPRPMPEQPFSFGEPRFDIGVDPIVPFERSPDARNIPAQGEAMSEMTPFGRAEDARDIPIQGRTSRATTDADLVGNKFQDAVRFAAPLLDNLAAARGISRLEAPPAPVTESPINLDNEYNIDAALTANNKAVNTAVTGASRTSGNASQIAAMRAMMTGSKIQGNNQLFTQKFNAENDSRNRETMINSQIGARNTNRVNSYLNMTNQFRNSRTQMRAQNFANIGQDVQDVMAGERRAEVENEQMQMWRDMFSKMNGQRSNLYP